MFLLLPVIVVAAVFGLLTLLDRLEEGLREEPVSRKHVAQPAVAGDTVRG